MNAFIDTRHGQHISPCGQCRLRDLDGAMAISISLDNGHQAGLGVGDAPQFANIVINCLKIDFSPDIRILHQQ